MSKKFEPKTLFDLEKEGRELATKIQLTKPIEEVQPHIPEDIFEKANNIVSDINHVISEIADTLQTELDLDQNTEEALNINFDIQTLDSLEKFLHKMRGNHIFISNNWKLSSSGISDIFYIAWLGANDLLKRIEPLYSNKVGKEKAKETISKIKPKIEELKTIHELAEKLHNENRLIRKKLIKHPADLVIQIIKYLERIKQYMNLTLEMLDKKRNELYEKFNIRTRKTISYEKIPRSCKKIPECKKEAEKLNKLQLATIIIKNMASALKRKIDVERFNLMYVRSVSELNPVDINSIEIAIPHELPKTIKQAYERLSELLGRPVGFMWRIKDVLSWSALINDLANAVHILADELEKIGVIPRMLVTKKCYGIGELDPRAVKLCVEWDKATEEGYMKGLYIDEDYEMLYGTINGNRVSLTVGSAPGHATEVEFKDDNMIVRYYDTDYAVNKTMKEKFENCGCKCEHLPFQVKCECKADDKTIECVAKIISEATSMDIRLGKTLIVSPEGVRVTYKKI